MPYSLLSSATGGNTLQRFQSLINTIKVLRNLVDHFEKRLTSENILGIFKGYEPGQKHNLVVFTVWLTYPWTKWSPFRRRDFQMHFHEWKILPFDSNFSDVCSRGLNWQQVSVGSGNGLAPNRRQVIIGTNANPVHWRICAALGGDEIIMLIAWHRCVLGRLKTQRRPSSGSMCMAQTFQWCSGRTQTPSWLPPGALGHCVTRTPAAKLLNMSR